MSVRWRVKGVPLKNFNEGGGSIGEPFAIFTTKDGSGTIVLTKQEVFYEGDEPKSSQHEGNQQLERERG